MQAIQKSFSSRTATASASEFISFRVGNEEYAINVLAVQEIFGVDAVSSLVGAAKLIITYKTGPNSNAIKPKITQFLTCLRLRL